MPHDDLMRCDGRLLAEGCSDKDGLEHLERSAVHAGRRVGKQAILHQHYPSGGIFPMERLNNAYCTHTGYHRKSAFR